MSVVLDADVVIGALDGSDAHHGDARALFERWQERGEQRLLSVVNLTEVLVAPALEKRRLHRAREAIGALGVTLHRPREAVAVDAARLRGAHPISLPDAYCLATARGAGAVLVSFDENLVRVARAEAISLAC